MNPFPDGMENLGLTPWALVLTVAITVLLFVRSVAREKRANRAIAIEIAAVEQYVTQTVRESIEGRTVVLILNVRNVHGTVWHMVEFRADHPDFVRLEKGRGLITDRFVRFKYFPTKQPSGGFYPRSFLRIGQTEMANT